MPSAVVITLRILHGTINLRKRVSDWSESVSDFVPFRRIFNSSENAIQPRKTVLLIDSEAFKFSVPAASTHAGVTTRLKTKQARQHQLASLSFLPHVSRDFHAFRKVGRRSSQDAPHRKSAQKRLKRPQRLKVTGYTPNASCERKCRSS